MTPPETPLAQAAAAYVVLLLGIYGVTFACVDRRAGVPGALGAIALLAALVAFHGLAASYGSLALILIGAALLAAEFHVPFAGVLGASGLLAFVIGSATLIEAGAVARVLLAAAAVLGALGELRVTYLAMRRAHPPGN